MTVRRYLAPLLVTCALLFSAGCSGGDPTAVTPESEDSLYKEGKQQLKQSRNPEALSSFLKVIEKRGAQTSPESHLEAGLIYLNHIRDFNAAIYHFRKFLELQTNSKNAGRVRELVDTATREFARTLPARPYEDQRGGAELREQVDRLQRENAELHAELLTLRGHFPAPVSRITRGPIVVEEPRPSISAAQPLEFSPLTIAPPPPRTYDTSKASPLSQAPNSISLAPVAPRRVPTAPTRFSGRTHTVLPKETLYGISRRYGVKMEDIVEANRAIITSPGSVPIGSVLRIP